MPKANELTVSSANARAQLGWSRSYMTAVRRAMGITRRMVFISELTKFLHDHPDFKIDQIYHRSSCNCPECEAKRKGREKVRTPERLQENVVGDGTGVNSTRTDEATSSSVKVAASSPASELSHWAAILLEGRTEAEIISRAKISRETLRKLRRGICVKLITLRRLRACVHPSNELWQNVLAAWTRAELGEDNAYLNVCPRTVSNESSNSSQIELLALAGKLKPEDQHQLVLTMTRPEVRQVLPALNEFYRSLRCPRRARDAEPHPTRSSEELRQPPGSAGG